MLGVWPQLKLQAVVYDILLEEGAGKRCSECGPGLNSKHWFTTSSWKKVPETDTRSVAPTLPARRARQTSTGRVGGGGGGRGGRGGG